MKNKRKQIKLSNSKYINKELIESVIDFIQMSKKI